MFRFCGVLVAKKPHRALHVAAPGARIAEFWQSDPAPGNIGRIACRVPGWRLAESEPVGQQHAQNKNGKP